MSHSRPDDLDPPEQKVDALLKAAFIPGSFLESQTLPGEQTLEMEAAVSPLSEGPGTRIGPYKLLQQIGAGGMGVVYMAEQEQPVRRRIALKIIKPGMDSAQVVARFEAERQALALMDHQNIARVHDAGATANGRPYFVMELVHGVPLTTYCDANRLTPQQRLRLFIPVCQAVQHAHQKGIIHRDLKPTNILVTLYDGNPVPKVIDFGIAKATEQKLTDRTMFTHYGTIVGTLEYMAPEQAEMSALGVDTRSDIYSLGVILYELLTGSTPLESKRLREAAFTDMLRLIKEEEPQRPSLRLTSSAAALATIAQQRGVEPAKLTKMVRGELDWIVLRCLEKDRTRRYETANALVRDIERYLADEPVEACPPSASYRLRKLAGKYRKSFAGAGAFAFLLVAAVVISNWQAARAREERADTQSAMDFLENELLAHASPNTEPDRDIKLKTVMERVSGRMGSLNERPLVEARIRRTVGRIQMDLGQFLEARIHLERAYQLHQQVLGARHIETLKSLYELVRRSWSIADYEATEPLAREGFEIAREFLGAEHTLTFDLQRTLARTYLFNGQSLKGAALLEPTLELSRRKYGEEREETLGLMTDLGVCLRVHDPAKSESLLVRAREGRLALHGPENPFFLITTERLAIHYGRQGQYAKEEELARTTLQVRTEVLGDRNPFTLQSMTTLAHAYLGQRKTATAEALVRRLLELSNDERFAENPFHLIGMRTLASAYQSQGDWARAAEIYQVLVKKTLPGRGGAALRRDRLLVGLGESLLRQEKYVEAEPHLRECVAFREKQLPENRSRFEAMSLLGRSLAGQRKHAGAEPLLIQGFAGMKQRENEVLTEDPDADDRKLSLAEAGGWIVEMFEGWGKKDESATWQRQIEALR